MKKQIRNTAAFLLSLLLVFSAAAPAFAAGNDIGELPAETAGAETSAEINAQEGTAAALPEEPAEGGTPETESVVAEETDIPAETATPEEPESGEAAVPKETESVPESGSETANGPVPVTEPDPEPGNTEPAVRVSEMTELRETNSETYLLSDGTYECVVYAEDVYYKTADGALAAIDNTLIPKGDGYTNAANAYNVTFSADEGVTVTSCEAALRFKPRNADLTKGAVYSEKAEEFPLDDMAGRESNRIDYANVYQDVDLTYTVLNGCVKECITLASFEANGYYLFDLYLDGVTPATDETGNIIFVSADGKEVFALSSMYAMDAAGEYSDAVTGSIRESNGRYVLSISLDLDWLRASERVFPVVIDPTVSVSGTAKCYDTFVCSKYPTTNYKTNSYLRCGYISGYYRTLSYVEFVLPSTIPGADCINSAYITLQKYSGETTSAFKAYRITNTWSASTITWNTAVSHASSGYAASSNSLIDVTGAIRAFVKGTYSNNGFALIPNSEYANGTTYYSSDAASGKPVLTVNYTRYGSRSYQASYFSDQNCCGYALSKTKWYSLSVSKKADAYIYTNTDLNGMTLNAFYSNTPNAIYSFISGKVSSCRRLSAYNSSLNTGEYRVVCRFGISQDDSSRTTIDANADFIGFHWWYQCENGYWAHKMGNYASELIPNSYAANPVTSSFSAYWIGENDKGGSIVYDSTPIYFAIIP